MKKVCLAVLPALTIVLELLPLGAVCIFATSAPDENTMGQEKGGLAWQLTANSR